MHSAHFDGTFAGWRQAARRLLQQGVPAAQVIWCEQDAGSDLFADLDDAAQPQGANDRIRVPRQLLDLRRRVQPEQLVETRDRLSDQRVAGRQRRAASMVEVDAGGPARRQRDRPQQQDVVQVLRTASLNSKAKMRSKFDRNI